MDDLVRVTHTLSESFSFNENDDYDVSRAKAVFDKKTEAGFVAYYVDPFGMAADEMKEFDPCAGTIIFAK